MCGVRKNRHMAYKRVNVKFLHSENLTWRRVEESEDRSGLLYCCCNKYHDRKQCGGGGGKV